MCSVSHPTPSHISTIPPHSLTITHYHSQTLTHTMLISHSDCQGSKHNENYSTNQHRLILCCGGVWLRGRVWRRLSHTTGQANTNNQTAADNAMHHRYRCVLSYLSRSSANPITTTHRHE